MFQNVAGHFSGFDVTNDVIAARISLQHSKTSEPFLATFEKQHRKGKICFFTPLFFTEHRIKAPLLCGFADIVCFVFWSAAPERIETYVHNWFDHLLQDYNTDLSSIDAPVSHSNLCSSWHTELNSSWPLDLVCLPQSATCEAQHDHTSLPPASKKKSACKCFAEVPSQCSTVREH